MQVVGILCVGILGATISIFVLWFSVDGPIIYESMVFFFNYMAYIKDVDAVKITKCS